MIDFEELDLELDPPTQLELNLGLCLAALQDVLDNPEQYDDPLNCIGGILNRADEWLPDWNRKYADFVRPLLENDEEEIA